MIGLIYLLLIILLFVFSAILTLFLNWKYYKSIYNTLEVKNFEKANNEYNQVKTKNDKIIWFVNKNDFKLNDGVYLHNSIVTYFDPYSLYWYIKYKKWFNENCNHLKYE